MTGASKEAQVTPKVALNRVPYINYPVQFQKNKGVTIQALINSFSKLNMMTLAYTK